MKLECRTWSGTARTVLALGVLSAGLAQPLGAQSTDTVWLNANHDIVQQTYLGGEDIEGELNCDEIVFPRADVRAILQNVAGADSGFSAQMRHMAKIVFQEAVLWHGGHLSSAHAAGTIHGVEFDWFFPNGTTPPTSNRLAEEAEVWGYDDTGAAQLVAKVYAYDQSQYDQRKAAVEAAVGHALVTYRVWADNAVTNTGIANNQLRVSGSFNDLYGYPVSGGNFRDVGTNNAYHHGLGYEKNLTLDPTSTAWFTDALASVSVPSTPIAQADARTQAQSSGTYAAGALLISDTNLPPNGLVFAEGNITVACANRTRTWTLISAGGKVAFSGDGNTLDAHLSDVIALSYTDRVTVTGDDNSLVGEGLAPQGRFEVSGSGNTLMGIVVGTGVMVSGSANTLSDGTHPIDP